MNYEHHQIVRSSPDILRVYTEAGYVGQIVREPTRREFFYHPISAQGGHAIRGQWNLAQIRGAIDFMFSMIGE